MPVFDGLFPEPHNNIIQDLIFTCAHWHALAKLRMHTDLTLKILEEVTISLGDLFRQFDRTTCAAYKTLELPREFEARKRREGEGKNSAKSTSEQGTTRRRRTFNMATYKFHALADYPDMIRLYGTCDSYSTELVCFSCFLFIYSECCTQS